MSEILSNQSIQTDMKREIEQIPDAIERLLLDSENKVSVASAALRDIDPKFITTVARGSSDHATAYLKYAIELCANVPVASLGPSTASIYGKTLKLQNSACLLISQSGASPDILRMAEAAKLGGAKTIAITNNLGSRLADITEHVLDLQAGVEKSVAATKTFVNSIVAGLLLLSKWTGDEELSQALKMLPEQAAEALTCDWSMLHTNLVGENSMFVLGRGPSMAIANEVALKFKETCQIHAEAYSSAEVLHGPVSIVDDKYPILVLNGYDASHHSVSAVADELKLQGAEIFSTTKLKKNANDLPIQLANHPILNPLLIVISFYAFVEKLSRNRGLNPDVPPNLRKVTKTI